MEKMTKVSEKNEPFICGAMQTIELDGCKIVLRFPAKQNEERLQSIEKVLCSSYSVCKNAS